MSEAAIAEPELATEVIDSSPPEALAEPDGTVAAAVAVDGTAPAPADTGALDGDLGAEIDKAWADAGGDKPETGKPAAPLVSKADEEYQARLDTLARQRADAYGRGATDLVNRAHAEARAEGLTDTDSAEYKDFMEKALRPYNALHSSAEYHMASRYMEAAEKILGPELGGRFKLRQYADPETIFRSFAQDLLAWKDQEWGEKVKADYVHKDIVEKFKTTLKHVRRGEVERAGALMRGGEAIGGGTAESSQDDAKLLSDQNTPIEKIQEIRARQRANGG